MAISKGSLVAGSVVLLGLVGTGGYFLRGAMNCSGLEEDYLNSVSSLKQTASLRAWSGLDKKLDADLEGLEKNEREIIERRLTAVYHECGSRAGQTAARKGSEMTLGR